MQNISCRQFAHRLFQILMAGGFAHFTFTDTVLATDSPFLPPLCPGGGHSQDFCQPATSESEESDTCPGGRDTEDVCLPELKYSDDCRANADSCLLSMPAGDEPCLQDRCEEEDLCRENDSCGTEDVCEASDACLQGDTVE